MVVMNLPFWDRRGRSRVGQLQKENFILLNMKTLFSGYHFYLIGVRRRQSIQPLSQVKKSSVLHGKSSWSFLQRGYQ